MYPHDAIAIRFICLPTRVKVDHFQQRIYQGYGTLYEKSVVHKRGSNRLVCIRQSHYGNHSEYTVICPARMLSIILHVQKT